MGPMADDYYEILGVTPEASQDEIKRSYRRLVKELHPDRNPDDPGAEERFKTVSEAYAVLSDPQRRREYDAARMGVGGFSPFGSTIEDIFDTFFGGTPGRRGPGTRARRGEPIEVTLELDFRETVFGTERSLRFDRMEPCETCDASGCAPGTEPRRCEQCGGTGQVQQVRRSMLGDLVTAYPCAACGESGWRVEDPCPDCGGSGRVGRETEIEIEIPPGVETGDRMRVRGQGEAGSAGGGRGDLYVRFVVQPDERFARAGDELVTWAEIPVTTAALGGDVHFESLDGPERIEVPRGTQSGDSFRVRDRGMVRRVGRGRGDLIVRIHVATPTELDGEQEELLRRLADMRGEVASQDGGIMGRLRRALRMEG